MPSQYKMHMASYPPTDRNWKSITLDRQFNSKKPPVICNIQLTSAFKPGQTHVIIADTQDHSIRIGSWKNNSWQETVLATDINAPARANPCDFDGDGDLDFLIADLGDVFPNNGLVGNVLLLENVENQYQKKNLISGLGRVADVQSADFNNDGLLDLAIAEFGHGHGRVLLALQNEDKSFKYTTLLPGPGCIHVPVGDFNNDGHIDIACVLSQEEEEVWVCYNNGNGVFEPQCIFKSMNSDFGCAGLTVNDIDQDGDLDLLLPHGDNLEEFFHYPQTYHGCLLFVNQGMAQFNTRKISDLPGCYAASCGDIDHDGDQDVVLLSMVNDWRSEQATSVQILVNKGDLTFEPKQLANKPVGLITCAIGDINNDGKNDIIAGRFCVQPPFEFSGRIHAWINE